MVRAFISIEARTPAYFESMDSAQNLRFKTLSVCSRDGKWHDAGREKDPWAGKVEGFLFSSFSLLLRQVRCLTHIGTQ